MTEKSELDLKLDFIYNRLLEILCYVEVQYEHRELGYIRQVN